MVSILITVLKKFDTKFDTKYNGGGGGGILVFLSMSAPARFGFKSHETNLAEYKNKIIKSAINSTTT